MLGSLPVSPNRACSSRTSSPATSSRGCLTDVSPGVSPVVGVVMGSIYAGIATPTESAALGVLMALVLAALARTLNWKSLNQAFRNTASLTGMIALIIAAAFILNVTLNALDVPQMLSRAVTSIGVTPTSFILMLPATDL